MVPVSSPPPPEREAETIRWAWVPKWWGSAPKKPHCDYSHGFLLSNHVEYPVLNALTIRKVK